MIVIRVWGGIGNQLFQYVFGEYLRHRFAQIVKYDDGSFDGVELLRKRELDILDTEIMYDATYAFSRCRGLKNRVLRTIFQLNPQKHLIIEGRSSLPNKFKKNHLYYFQGYWQTSEYYEWLKQNVPGFEIKAKYVPQELQKWKGMIAASSESVSVHIRRGDYFLPHNINTYGVCTKDYYHNALKYILTTFSGAKFFVFTDDIDWVRNNINFPTDSTIVPNHEISQFAYIELMSCCKHHIISNSSFSWWGAVLNEQNGAMVITPNKWTLVSDKSIALSDWIKMKV